MTEYPVGSREQVVIAEESTYGNFTGTFDDGWILGHNIQVTPNFTRNFQEITNNGSDSLELISLEPGAKLYSFQLRFNPYDFRWLKYCPTHANVSNLDKGTYYTHEFTTDGNDINSFAMQWSKRQEENQIIELYGCVITDWKLDWSKGTGQKDSFLTVTANCIAKTHVDGTAIASVSYPPQKPFNFYELKFTLDGTTIPELNSGSLSFSTNINPQDSLYAYSDNNSEISQPIPVRKRYTLSTNINSSNKNIYQEWDGSVISGTNKLEILRSTNDTATFIFTNLYLDTAPLGETNPEGISPITLVGIPTTIEVSVNDGNAEY